METADQVGDHDKALDYGQPGDEKKHQAIDENGEVAKVKIDGNASEGNATLKTEKSEAGRHVLQGSHPEDSALATSSTTYSRPQVLGALLQLPLWWIYALTDFVWKNQERVHESWGPVMFGDQEVWWVKIQEKPIAQLTCQECAKGNSICRKKSTHTDWRLCPICEQHRCDHGDRCTRGNLGCKWCHFHVTGECFFNGKDRKKLMRSINYRP